MNNKITNDSYKRPLIGTFVLDGLKPNDLARSMIESGLQREPFHIFDMDEAHRRIQYFKTKLPRVKICYAMKSNDYEMMLKLNIAEGGGFDCASPGEIRKVVQLGADPRSIIYAVTIKTREQMMYARKAGVKHTTFDTLHELQMLKKYWPDASLLIRVRVESKSLYKLGDKFGCDFEEAFNLVDEAFVLGLRVAGVAFHVGSVCFSPESYRTGLKYARALFDHEAAAGRHMTLVDIGGGFLSDRTDTIDEVAEIINSTLEELFPERNIQITAEPGRYLCDSSFTLYTNILNIRKVKRNEKIINFIYINDGIYGTLRYSESWHTVEKFQVNPDHEMTSKDLLEMVLYGPSGDSYDVVMEGSPVRLPPCSTSDWLVFRTQGAYTINFSTNFSCLPTPQTRPVISKQLWKAVENHPVFINKDFVLNPDISAPLPSSLPPLPQQQTSFYDSLVLAL